jgi:hypothetical protein
MTIYEANIDLNDIADRAVDAVTARFASFGLIPDESTDQRIWEAVWEQLKNVELTPSD